MGKKITITLFLVTIFTLSVITFVAKDREFSEMENRTLSGKPEFSGEKLLAGEFADDLEKYLSDQLFLKDNLVMLKNSVDFISGKDMLGGVYYHYGRYIRNFEEDEAQVNKNMMFINNWITKNEISSDKVSFVLAPTASYVFNEYLPDSSLSDNEKDTFDLIEKSFNGKFISLKEAMENTNKSMNVYYKTDHHWTMEGAYYGYKEVMNVLGKEAKALSSFREITLDEKFMGSLYSQAPLFGVEGDTVTFYDYKDLDYTITYENDGKVVNSFLVKENFDIKDKYTALFGGNYGRMTITNNDNPDGPKLIIFKDSYANSIMPYLISHYSVIEVIDLRYTAMRPGFYNDKKDYEVMFIYNTDFINTDNNFVKLMNF